MCCLNAIAAESKVHIDIAKKAKRLIVINGCGNKCTSKILDNLGIKPTYEFTIVNERKRIELLFSKENSYGRNNGIIYGKPKISN